MEPCLWIFIAVLVWLGCPSSAQAQISAPHINWETQEDGHLFRHNFGTSISTGTPYERDAYFWGFAANYTYLIGFPWSCTFAIAYDQEIDRPSGKPKEISNTLTAIVTGDYSPTQWLTVSSGIGKGFADDSNGSFNFHDGDWATGISMAMSVPESRFEVLESVSLSFSWEWNISQQEPSVSCDLGYSWSF